MKPSTKAKVISKLNEIKTIIEKCGGAGGTPGPCPTGEHENQAASKHTPIPGFRDIRHLKDKEKLKLIDQMAKAGKTVTIGTVSRIITNVVRTTKTGTILRGREQAHPARPLGEQGRGTTFAANAITHIKED